MTQFTANVIFCCLLFFAGNICAQGPEYPREVNIDIELMKHLGGDISIYPGVDKTKVANNPGLRSLRAGNVTYEYNRAHKVYSITIKAPATDNETRLAGYKNVFDAYNKIKALLGEPDKTHLKDGFTYGTYNGKHGVIVLGNNPATGFISILFDGTDIFLRGNDFTQLLVVCN